MNRRNLAITAAIGLLCLLLGTSLFLQFRQPTPLSIDDVTSRLQQELSPIKADIKLLDQELVALKKEDDLKKQIKVTNESVEKLKGEVEALKTSTTASEKNSIAALAGSGRNLLWPKGGIGSDPKLKLEWEEAVRSAVPQRKSGKLIVANDFLNRSGHAGEFDLIIDTPDRRQLAERIPAGKTPFDVGTFQVGTRISSPFNPAVRFTIEAPEFDLRLRIDENGLLLPLAR